MAIQKASSELQLEELSIVGVRGVWLEKVTLHMSLGHTDNDFSMSFNGCNFRKWSTMSNMNSITLRKKRSSYVCYNTSPPRY
jgi:hypothetical protein